MKKKKKILLLLSVQFNHLVVSDSATPRTAARQASLSITHSRSLLQLMSIELVMPSNYLILCHPLLLLPSIFPSIRVFSSESVLHIRCQSNGVSASASVLPVNIQDWSPLGWAGSISLQSKGLSRVFSAPIACNMLQDKRNWVCEWLYEHSPSSITLGRAANEQHTFGLISVTWSCVLQN